jgi:heat shock protein HslJ
MDGINLATPTRVVLFKLLFFSAITACATDTVKQDSEAMAGDRSLPGTAWWVEDIDGRGVVDRSHTTIEFTEDGRVVGDTGCNRYFGGVTINGAGLSFSTLAGTRKACIGSLMDQEKRFYQTMEKVSQWEIAETRLLHLRDADGKDLIRAAATDDP